MSHHYFTFEPSWRTAPVAFWVHVPNPVADAGWEPPLPAPVPHRGYAVLHVAFAGVDLRFSAPAQLDHFIEVLDAKLLPTSRQLSLRRGVAVGPNGHWLSRLPARLKAPRQRARLVRLLRGVRARVVEPGCGRSFLWTAPGGAVGGCPSGAGRG